MNMEANINVAAILKDKPQGTKLYADAFGELSIEEICTEDEDEMEMFDKEDIKEAIGLGAEWAINELLKDLLHPASEVPRNDNGKILAFSKEIGYRKLYDMNAMLDETDCYTYQDMWENEVNKYRLSDWIFVEELFNLIIKGGKQ